MVRLQSQELFRALLPTAADNLGDRDLRVVVADPLGNATEEDREASVRALCRAWREIKTSIQAVKKKTFVPTGGLSDAWWFRTGAAGFILAGIALLMNQIVIPSLTPL